MNDKNTTLNGINLLSILIELYAEQEGVQIEYELKEKNQNGDNNKTGNIGKE